MIPESEFSHGTDRQAARQQDSEGTVGGFETLNATVVSEATILQIGKHYFHSCMGFVSTALNIYIFLWIMTPCYLVGGYQCFGGTCDHQKSLLQKRSNRLGKVYGIITHNQ
jgi:hypothetical protein